MRALVTGANGLLGSRLCRELVGRGHQVLGVSRGERRAQGAFDYCSADLSLEAEVTFAFERGRPDVVVNCASMTEVDKCEKDLALAWAANVAAPMLVARAARVSGAHLVHVSTDYVFDGEKGPYREDDLPNPRGAYALSKHMGEEAVRLFCPSWAIARTAVVFGWPAAGRANFGSWLVDALSKGQEVKLFSDQFVSPTLADNGAQMLAELAERRLAGHWNICGATVVDRVAFGEALCARFGFDRRLLVPTRMKDVNLPSPRPARSGLLTDKAQGALDAKPLPLGVALDRFHSAWKRAE